MRARPVHQLFIHGDHTQLLRRLRLHIRTRLPQRRLDLLDVPALSHRFHKSLLGVGSRRCSPLARHHKGNSGIKDESWKALKDASQISQLQICIDPKTPQTLDRKARYSDRDDKTSPHSPITRGDIQCIADSRGKGLGALDEGRRWKRWRRRRGGME